MKEQEKVKILLKKSTKKKGILLFEWDNGNNLREL